MKTCSNKECPNENPQPISEFYKSNRNKDGLHYKCKTCFKKERQEYLKTKQGQQVRKGVLSKYNQSEKAKEQAKAYSQSEKGRISRRWRTVKHRYNITKEDYENLLSAQDGVCKICSYKPEEGEFLPIDHCHLSSKVRGLLCHSCNKSLGGFKDSIELLKSAIKYLSN